MKLSITVLIGFILGWAVIIIGIALNRVGFSPYLNIPSLFITVGGTICATLIGAPTGFLSKFRRCIKIAFSNPSFDYSGAIENLVTLSDKARRDGLLALEDEIVDIPSEFTRKGLQMVVDGTDPDVIRGTLTTQIDEMQSRHEQMQNAFELIGRIAPAFGLIGTIIGLIALLGNIGGDPVSIGRGMQVALITTFYGAILANFIFIPIAHRLKEVDVEESRYYFIVLEGIFSIQSGENPRIVKDKLLSFLSEETRMNTSVADDKE